MHIMVIDDEKILSKQLKTKLERNWYEVSLINSYKQFLKTDTLDHIDLFLVDISLWDGNWIDIVKMLKKSTHTQDTSIIFISWHTELSLKIQWLDAWGDDYIMKPFEFDELLARIRSNLRKKYPTVISSTLKYKNITFETSSRSVFLNKEEITLSKKEKQILEHMMLYQGTCISKHQLQKMFWKTNMSATLPENTINVTICNLRKKIWKQAEIKTIRWEWYTLL